MITSRDIEKETRVLIKSIEKIEKKYSEIGEKGKLRICQKRAQTDLYFRNDSSERWSYLSKSEINRARALAQKDYYERVLKILKRKLRGLKMLDGQSTNDALLSLYDKLHPVRKELVNPVILPDEEFVRKWKEEASSTLGFEEDDESSFYTDNNERVRSKSEIMIANKFLQRGIPYLYEPSLELGGRMVHPDFKVLNLKTRQSFYFEHFGRMDDPEYSTRAVLKINSYIMNGYLPGQGLLFTMESRAKPMDMRVLDAMIDEYLM